MNWTGLLATEQFSVVVTLIGNFGSNQLGDAQARLTGGSLKDERHS